MKEICRLVFTRVSAVKGLAGIVACSSAAFLSLSATAAAGILNQPSRPFGGVYQVSSSSDPMFPASAKREYFLDFGEGGQSGNVAVSVRENPHVKVRIMAWQYFPSQAEILIGNPFSEGSNRAVARGVWKMKPVPDGMLLERGGYRVVLRTADPADY